MKLHFITQEYIQFLKNEKSETYTTLIVTGEWEDYITNLNLKIKKEYEYIINSLSSSQNITEELKAQDPIKWVQKMNTIQMTAKEIIINELFV